MSWDSWVGFWGVDDFLQGYDDQAKQSTRLLARGGSAVTCDDDISQYETDLSTNVTYCFEASTTRFNRGAPRTIGFRLEASNTHTGTLFRHGSGANTETFGFSSANNIRIVVNNAVVITQTLTVLTASADEIVLAWAQIANPDTTGAGDAILSWIHVWNVTAGTYEKIRTTHAAKTLQAGATAVWGANTHPAGTAFTGTITGWWFENRTQTATEIAADWVDSLVAPTSEAVTDTQGVPVVDGIGFDGEGENHGPAVAHACDATRRLERRLLQPLWNERPRLRPTWTAALIDATTAWLRNAPGASGWRMHLTYLRAYPVPETCNRLWVRVQVRTWTSSGAAVPLGVRLYSFNKPPGAIGLVGDPGANDPLVPYYATATITRDDDAAEGQYTVLGELPISRGLSGIREGMTYLALALNVDPTNTSANDANANFEIGGVHVVPLFRENDLPLPVSP